MIQFDEHIFQMGWFNPPTRHIRDRFVGLTMNRWDSLMLVRIKCLKQVPLWILSWLRDYGVSLSSKNPSYGEFNYIPKAGIFKGYRPCRRPLHTSRKRPKLQIQDADRPLRRTLTPPLGTLRQQMWNKCIEPTKRSFERIRAHAMQKADKGGADYSPSASNIANGILGSGKTETTLRKSRLEAQLPSIKLLGNSTRKHAAKLSRNLATEHRFRKPRTAKHKR